MERKNGGGDGGCVYVCERACVWGCVEGAWGEGGRRRHVSVVHSQ